MIEDNEPAQEEGWESFKYEHVGRLRVSTIDQGFDVGNDGSDEGDGGTKPEDFSGHTGSNHECLGFGFFLVDLIPLWDKGLILFDILSDQVPSIILN